MPATSLTDRSVGDRLVYLGLRTVLFEMVGTRLFRDSVLLPDRGVAAA